MVGNKRALPESLQRALRVIGETPMGARLPDALLAQAIADMDKLDPRYVPEAERMFRKLARLRHSYWTWSPNSLSAGLTTLIRGAASPSRDFVQHRFGWKATPRRDGAPDITALSRQPALASIFLRHSNGFVREAALHTFGPAPVSAFIFASLAYRLNDWVAPVRAAAAAALERVTPRMPLSTIAQAVPFLLTNSAAWGRWSQYDKVLEPLFVREDVVAALADRVAAPSQGGEIALLKHLMRRPTIDHALPRLAGAARAPAVRAIASEALIIGRAKLQTGWRRYWIDKSVGAGGRTPIFQMRTLTIDVQQSAALLNAARDRASAVRKVAADAVIAGFPDHAAVAAVVELLKDDCNQGVRQRIAFVLRQQTGQV